MLLCQSHLNDFVNYMDTEHPNIKFTSEFERNDSLSFLDVKIARSNSQLVTSVFHKATFSVVFTYFKSFMPDAYTFDLVYTLLHCSFFICSSYEKFHEEIVLIKDIFKKNEYTQFFTDKCIKNYLKVVSTIFLQACFLSPKETTCETRKNVFYFTSKALFVLKKIKF